MVEKYMMEVIRLGGEVKASQSALMKHHRGGQGSGTQVGERRSGK